MKSLDSVRKYHLFAICLAILGLVSIFPAKAQFNVPELAPLISPNFDFIISWRAVNYVPADFSGKILPSKNSKIEISFDVLDLDSGKFIDITQQQIEWYLNDAPLKSGVGLKSVVFPINSGNSRTIEIIIPNYSDSKYNKGKYNGSELNVVTTIPVASPEIVINAPYPNKTISIGENLFQALPYFFNINTVNQLKIGWDVDGTEYSNEQASRQDILNLSATTQGQVAEGANFSIQASAQNLLDKLEMAQDYINLDIK